MASLGAQNRLPRTSGTAVLGYKTTVESGYLVLEPTDEGRSVLIWDRFVAGTPAHREPMPFAVPGAIAEVASGRFVVSGVTYDGATPTTHMVEVELAHDPIAVMIVSSSMQSGIDLVELAVHPSEQVLYAIDFVTDALLFAPWPGATPPPGTFTTAVTSGQLPLLEDGPLIKVDDAPGVDVLSRIEREGSGHMVRARVQFVGSGWSVTPVYANPTPSPSQWAFSDWQTNARGPLVDVIGHSGASGDVQLEDVNGAVILSGAVSATGTGSILVPHGALLPGARYRITGGGHLPSSWQTVNSEWGVRTSGDLKLRRSAAVSLYCGNPSFAVTVRGFWDGEHPPARAPQTYLLIGCHTGADDVTLDPETNAAEIAEVCGIVGPLPMEMEALGEQLQGACYVEFPIPAGLEGLELLFQWRSWDGARWSTSDVFGSLVFPAQGSDRTHEQLARSRVRRTTGKRPAEGESKMRALCKWLAASPDTAPTPAKRAALRVEQEHEGDR